MSIWYYRHSSYYILRVKGLWRTGWFLGMQIPGWYFISQKTKGAEPQNQRESCGLSVSPELETSCKTEDKKSSRKISSRMLKALILAKEHPHTPGQSRGSRTRAQRCHQAFSPWPRRGPSLYSHLLLEGNKSCFVLASSPNHLSEFSESQYTWKMRNLHLPSLSVSVYFIVLQIHPMCPQIRDLEQGCKWKWGLPGETHALTLWPKPGLVLSVSHESWTMLPEVEYREWASHRCASKNRGRAGARRNGLSPHLGELCDGKSPRGL